MTLARIHPGNARPVRSRLLSVTCRENGAPPDRRTVTVTGEVDASNAREFAEALCRAVDDGTEMVVDMTAVRFFGIDGVTALHAANAAVMRHHARWRVNAAEAVTRVLRLCDPACVIPLEPQGDLGRPAPVPEAEPA